MSWYYELNKAQQGPVSEEELRSIIAEGSLPPKSRVWTQGMSDWQEYESVFSESGRSCPTCGISTPVETWIPVGDTHVCPSCKDSYAQRLREGVSTNMVIGSRGTGGTLTAAELRARAREALTGNWASGVGATAVFYLISIAAAIVPLVGSLIQYIITGPLTVGMGRLFLNVNRESAADFGDLFKGFNQFLAGLGAYFVIAIISTLAFLGGALPGGIVAFVIALPAIQTGEPLTDLGPMFQIAVVAAIIPAIIAGAYVSLRYSLTYFVIADDEEEFGVFDSLKRSGDLMKGKMLKLIWLGITFIGWYVLGALCLGIGILWANTYFMAAFAAFYDDIHEGV